MALYTITAANVRASGSATITHGTAFETITSGQVVYALTSTHVGWLRAGSCTAGATTSGTNNGIPYDPVGIALHGASSGQPLSYVTSDTAFTHGGTSVIGDVLTLGPGAGTIYDHVSIATGWRVAALGVAISTTQAKIAIGSRTNSLVAR